MRCRLRRKPARPRVMSQARIRIAFLLPHLSTGGVERVILNLLRHLDRSRFDPLLILRDRRGDLLDDLPGDVPVDDLGGARAALAIPRLRRCLRRRSIAVAYAGTNVSNLAALAATAMMRRPPAVIVSEHTPLSHYWAGAKWRGLREAMMRLLYPRAWGIVVPIVDIADECRSLLDLPAHKIHILANPVLGETSGGEPQAPPPIPAKGPLTLVAAGRLEYVKGFDVLIRAMEFLANDARDWRLMILGEGPERPRLEALIGELGLTARVELPGRVADPATYYRSAFAVVVSSRFESGPNVLIEAMAVGTPVVSANCPFGPRRILLDGEAGVLVRPEDPQAIAAGVRRLADDPVLHACYRQKGLRRARDFTVESTLPAYEALFIAAAASRREQ